MRPLKEGVLSFSLDCILPNLIRKFFANTDTFSNCLEYSRWRGKRAGWRPKWILLSGHHWVHHSLSSGSYLPPPASLDKIIQTLTYWVLFQRLFAELFGNLFSGLKVELAVNSCRPRGRRVSLAQCRSYRLIPGGTETDSDGASHRWASCDRRLRCGCNAGCCPGLMCGRSQRWLP